MFGVVCMNSLGVCMKKRRGPFRVIAAGSAVVKVYRNAHPRTASGYIYQVSWHSGGIRRLQQFTDENAAVEEARLRAGQISTGQLEASTISRPDRDELRAAREISQSVPLLAALKEWRKAYDLTDGHVITAA